MAAEEGKTAENGVGVENRTRRIKTGESRRVVAGAGRRRIEGKGPFADYSAIKAHTGIVIPEIKKMLLARHAANAEFHAHKHDAIFPTELSKSDFCPRAVYFRMQGKPDPSRSFSLRLETVFAEGDRIHEKWQGWLAETGQLWGNWHCRHCETDIANSVIPDPVDDITSFAKHDWEYREVPLAAHMLRGRADGALVRDNCLVEIKSVGLGTLRFEEPELLKTYGIPTPEGKQIVDAERLWKNIHRPFMSHVRQGNLYLWMAEKMGLPFDKLVFIYEFKPNQDAKEFVITKSEETLKPMLAWHDQVVSAVTAGIAPDCPRGGCGNCRGYDKEE
jgi:hypothetical protein